MSEFEGEKFIRTLSLGAGVQSATMYLQAVAGMYPEKIHAAIFADTMWESPATYKMLDYLEEVGGDTIPIHRVSAGDLGEAWFSGHINKDGGHVQPPSIPWHLKNEDGSKGFNARGCSDRYKMTPLVAKVRELLGLEPLASSPRSNLSA